MWLPVWLGKKKQRQKDNGDIRRNLNSQARALGLIMLVRFSRVWPFTGFELAQCLRAACSATRPVATGIIACDRHQSIKKKKKKKSDTLRMHRDAHQLRPGRPTTVKWRQFSRSNRHSTIGTRQTEYHVAIPSSENVQSHLTSSFADDGNASWLSVCRVPMVEWWLDCEDCRHLTIVGLHDTGPRPFLALSRPTTKPWRASPRRD